MLLNRGDGSEYANELNMQMMLMTMDNWTGWTVRRTSTGCGWKVTVATPPIRWRRTTATPSARTTVTTTSHQSAAPAPPLTAADGGFTGHSYSY